MSVLLALVARSGGLVTRQELITEVWKHNHVSDEALSRCISILRRALNDNVAESSVLQTLPRRGYRLLVPAILIPEASHGEVTVKALSTLVVLPFQNLSGRANEEHIADGLTELLICNLACRPGLRVISRTSAMHYKGTTDRLSQIGHELKADLAVEGSVLRSDQNVQVVVQLIDVSTDVHLFSRTYTRAFADLLALQNEIAWAIAEALSEVVGQGRAAVASPTGPGIRAFDSQAGSVSEDALKKYLTARFLWAQRTPASFERALRDFEACVRAAPKFAPGFAGLADTLLIMALYGVVKPSAVSSRARACADRALELDPISAEALTARGGVTLFLDWDGSKAADWFRQALTLNPSHDVARLGLADTLMFAGRFDEGLRELKAAIRVNPFDLGLLMNEGEFLIWARRPREAVVALEKALDIGPHFWPARLRLARLLASEGNHSGARREHERALEHAPPTRRQSSEALLLATMGEADKALRELVAIEAARDSRAVSALDLARGFGLIGDAKRATHWIDVCIDERSPMLLALGIDVSFDRIRHNPEFQRRVEQCLSPLSSMP